MKKILHVLPIASKVDHIVKGKALESLVGVQLLTIVHRKGA
jgi:hypothetical protein